MKIASVLAGIGFATLTSLAVPALAARTGVGLSIGDITVYGSNARIFISSGISGSTPACASSHPNHFAINVSTDKGRAQLSIATAAMLSGKTINVLGLGTCLAVDTPGTLNWQELDQISMNP
jgi:hypothetical protein